jgi:DNA-dependent protein kinase catalytic subunit
MVLEERGKKNEESAHAIITDEDIVMTEAIDEPEEFEVNDEDQVYEIDVLNQHSFMRSLTEVIQRLHKKICPPTKDNSDMPQWMINLNAAFRNAKSIIIQVYIVKLITNYPFAFESYAKHWVLPLTEFITKGSQFGMPINYLIQDLCIVLIVWGRFTEIPDARSYSCKRILFNTMVFDIYTATCCRILISHT